MGRIDARAAGKLFDFKNKVPLSIVSQINFLNGWCCRDYRTTCSGQLATTTDQRFDRAIVKWVRI